MVWYHSGQSEDICVWTLHLATQCVSRNKWTFQNFYLNLMKLNQIHSRIPARVKSVWLEDAVGFSAGKISLKSFAFHCELTFKWVCMEGITVGAEWQAHADMSILLMWESLGRTLDLWPPLMSTSLFSWLDGVMWRWRLFMATSATSQWINAGGGGFDLICWSTWRSAMSSKTLCEYGPISFTLIYIDEA